jgi:DNA-binding IclR family transcriptional regulator
VRETLAGIKSVHTAFRILRLLADARRPLSLKALSEETGWSKSYIQHYLRSLLQLHAVVQRDGGYLLGPSLIDLGLAALQCFDVVAFAKERMRQLRDEVEETVALTLWTVRGPVFVHIEESLRPVNIGVRVGSHIAVPTSAVGQVYLAYLPYEDVAAVVSRADWERLREEVRPRGYAYTRGGVFPGIGAIAAPILGARGEVRAVLTVITTVDALDVDPEGSQVRALLRQAQELSRRLGAEEALLPGRSR